MVLLLLSYMCPRRVFIGNSLLEMAVASEAINWNKSEGVEGLIVGAITKPIIIFITEWLWCFERGNEKERK